MLRYGVTATRDRKRVSPLSPSCRSSRRSRPGGRSPSAWRSSSGASASIGTRRARCSTGRRRFAWAPTRSTAAPRRRVVRGAGRDRGEDDVVRGRIGPSRPPVPLHRPRRPRAGQAAPSRPSGRGGLRRHARRLPSPPPTGLLVLAEPEGTRLAWTPVLAPDLASYRVYRRSAADAGWTRVADGLKDRVLRPRPAEGRSLRRLRRRRAWKREPLSEEAR